LFPLRFLRSCSIPCPQAAGYDSSCVSYPHLLFTSLITSSSNVSVIVIIRITHCFPAPSEPSLQCIGSSSNGSDSRENIKSFDRLSRFNFGRFASTEDTAIQTVTLIFSRRSLVIAYVGHRVSLRPHV
jgi:hypothetical protein